MAKRKDDDERPEIHGLVDALLSELPDNEREPEPLAHLEGIEPGQQDGLVRKGRSHKPPETQAPTEPKKRGRKAKPSLGQATVFDFRLEDAELESLLEDAFETADAAKRHRDARKAIKEHLQRQHPTVVQGYVDVEADPADPPKGPYWICGNYRGMASAPEIPAKSVPAKITKSRHGWRFDAALLLNGGAVAEEA